MQEDFESYVIDDSTPEQPRLTMWQIVPRILVMPAAGWEKAKHNGPSPEIATIRFLLPVCLLAGASVFLSMLYPGHNNFTTTLVEAVVALCSFFIGFYVALVLSKLFLPKEARALPSSNYGKLMTMTGVSTLALFFILGQAFPMFDFIIEFFPLWTIFLLYKGMRIADVHTDKSAYAMGVFCIATICGPVFADWVFSLFI